MALPHVRELHHKQVWVARVRGQRAIEVMRALRPLMGSRRQWQIDAALAARSLHATRIPYATEVAEMVTLKASGATRPELAARYEIDPKTVNRLVGGYDGKRDRALAAAPQIWAAEDGLAAATGGSRELAWLAGIVEGEGSLIYFIGKKYKDLAACPRGEGAACKAEYAGSNPAAAS